VRSSDRKDAVRSDLESIIDLVRLLERRANWTLYDSNDLPCFGYFLACLALSVTQGIVRFFLIQE
jgi:hypothetical protein